MKTQRTSSAPRVRLAVLLALLGLPLFLAAPVGAQDAGGSVDDVFGGFGTAETADAEEGAPASEAAAGEGTVVGQVLERDSGLPISGATVILTWPPPQDGSQPADPSVPTVTSNGTI